VSIDLGDWWVRWWGLRGCPWELHSEFTPLTAAAKLYQANQSLKIQSISMLASGGDRKQAEPATGWKT
jgi:hypothetical protein